MGAVRRSRGRLPQRVYWVRRTLLLVVVLGTVLGVVHLVGGTGSDGSAEQDAALSGGAASLPPQPTLGPTQAVPVKPRKGAGAAPAQPSGPCTARDLSAVPVLDAPEAGGRVDIGVELTGTQPACTFEASAKTIVVKVTDAKGRDFWRSADCTGVIPTQQVVVRSAEPTTVAVRWSSRASDKGCGVYSRWAMPGFYDALASVQGSLPAKVRFELLPPSVRYVTETPSPTAKPKPTGTPKPSAGTTPSGSPEPSGSPQPTGSPRPSQG